MIRILFVLVPFGFLSGGLFTRSQTISFVLAVLMVYAVNMVKERALMLFGVYAVLWVIVQHLAALLNPALIPISGAAMNQAIFFIFAFAMYAAVSQSRVDNNSYYNAICIAAILQSLIGVLQVFGIDLVMIILPLFVDSIKDSQLGRAIGTLGNSNFYGGYIAISLPFFFRKHWKKFIPLLVFTLVPLTEAKISSAAIAAALTGVIVYYRFWWVIGVSLLVSIGVFIYDFESIISPSQRLAWWASTWHKIIASPKTFMFGYGPGVGTGYVFPIHNEWLECMFNFGAVGVVLLVAAVVRLTEGKDLILVAALMAACVNCLGNYPMHLAPSAFLIIIILGLLERTKGKKWLIT